MDNRRIEKIVTLLKRSYPENKIALRFTNPLELLIATILSAQCTDARVNEVTKLLFRKYKSVDDYASADPARLEQDIKPTGFYKNKARNIIECCKVLKEKHKGQVPSSLEELVKLPGVGRKTANVILGNAYGIPGIVVDTHVRRLAYRMGLTRNRDPEKIENDLMKIIPKDSWVHFSNAAIYHGRYICKARKPSCDKCVIEKQCKKVGL